MDTNVTENEELTLATAVPQTNSVEADVNSASPTTKDYTLDTEKKQVSSNNSSKPSVPDFYNFKTHSFMHNAFAKYANIKRFNGVNHIYMGSHSGIYKYDNELIECVLQKVVPKFSISDIKEEVQHLNIATKISEVQECPSNYAALNNGVYELYTSEFKEFTSCTPADYILTNKLNINYVPQIPTSNKTVDEAFRTIFGVLLELFAYEVIGACLCRYSLPLAFVLTGTNTTNGNDGRSIFLNIIKAIAGECVSFEGVQELITSKSFHFLYTKTCNISDEQYKTKMSNINRLVGLIRGNRVLPNKEFGGLTFKPYTTLLFNVRDVIDFDGVFSDLNGYVKIIPFNNQLKADNDIEATLLTPENLQYITMKALNAFANVLRVGKFSIPDVVEQATNDYLLDNNSARDFCLANPIFHIERKFDYYMQYRDWCDDNNKSPICNSQFGKEVIKLGYIPVRYSIGGGKRPCYYATKDFNVSKLYEQYANTIESNSIEVLSSNSTYSEGKFIEAFIDFFHRNTLEDMNEKTLTEMADANDRIEKAVKDLSMAI